ncbi:MAG: hypothetical protein IKM27_05815 [Clostridia bacterium]|nr:hypothetical protein [Clostridia bacterium]
MADGVKKYKAFILANLCAALAFAAARLLIIMNNIEVDSLENSDGLYYLEGTASPTVFVCFCIAAVIACLVGAMLLTGKVKFALNNECSSVAFASALIGFMLLTLAAYYLYRIVFEHVKYSAGFIAVIVLTVLSAVYFLSVSSKRANKKLARVLPLLSMIPIVLTAARLLYDFVDRSLTVTASSYGYHLMGLASLMLFLCCEGRFLVGYRRKRVYVALGLITSLLLLIYSVPALYLSLFWPLKLTDVTVYCVADLIMTVYIYCRLLSMPVSEEETVETVVE